MKEATGELNMTVITVVAVVAVGAFFTVFVLPGLQQSIQGQTICNNGANYMIGRRNQTGYISCGRVANRTFQCVYAQTSKDRNGNTSITMQTVQCKDQ